MIWLLRDFDLLSVFLRAASLTSEALALGGLAFLLAIVSPASIDQATLSRLRKITAWAALALGIVQACSLAISSAVLVSGSNLNLRDILAADFFLLGVLQILASLALFFLLRTARSWTLRVCLLPALLVLSASVGMSHAASRLDHRPILLIFTAAHHLGTALWIGAMPFLLLALRGMKDTRAASPTASRFSAMAISGVALLLAGGIGMALFYVGSWQGLYGTSYGLMVLAKSYLFLLILGLGAGNFFVARQAERAPVSLLMRLRRFGEAEIGLGFTAILAAASLTSQSPAVDVATDQLTGHEIVQHLRWVAPRLTSPPLQALAPPTSIHTAVMQSAFGGTTSDANDRAWSEYNHHWAGLIVLAAGCMALLSRSRRFRWAGNWPLLFIGLAVFILLRADPECWPLGPRPFWASFSAPDVLEHRLYALLITAFALFQWAVETGRIRSRTAAYIFPLLCAAGGAALLTHTHATGNFKDEVLAEMSHTPIALLGATAGWTRWLELRLPGKRGARIASCIWPICLVLAGIVLLDYRETYVGD